MAKETIAWSSAVIIENTRFGTIEIDEEKIIRMPYSMPGFPGRKRFILLERKESKPFLWYQSVDEATLAFVVMSPYLFKPDYRIDLGPIIQEMAWEEDGEASLSIFVVVNASRGAPEKMTANLMAPLIINTRRFEALQKVFNDSPYSHQYPIFSET
ncbi:MAG: flagellar assembly protein FliW [Deltaproteobacteria bacterium]|nr:flagellar assembly protein FliW [Deltaproteobacteria bacterium]